MHIIFFNRSFYPDQASTGQFLAELCEMLAGEYAHRVTVVAGPSLQAGNGDERMEALTRGRSSWWFRRERWGAVEILRAGGSRFSKRWPAGRFCNYLTFLFCAFRASRHLQRPELIVSLTDPPLVGLIAWRAARRFKVPFVFYVNDVFPEVARLLEDFRSPLIERTLQAVNRFLIGRADCVIALSDIMRRRLIQEKGARPEKTHVITHWADRTRIRPGTKANAFASRYGLEEGFVVMHAGNLGLSQNLDLLLEAAQKLAGDPAIQFVLIGDGVRKPALQKTVKDRRLENVRFLDYQPREALHDVFASADVFILSLKPGLSGYIVPSKLYGYLAAGRPIVAAVEEGSEAAAVIEKFECGIRVGPDDSEALAGALDRLRRDPLLAAGMGRQGREASRHFDREGQVRRMERLLTGVASRSRPSRLSAELLAPEGSRKNDFPFSHPILGPSWADLHSQNPQRSPSYACGFAPSDRPNLTPSRARIPGSYFCANPKFNDIWKRCFDVTLSGAGLVLSIPVGLIIAGAIGLEDGRPVFYRQWRIGRGGRPFLSWKFRSMRVREAEPGSLSDGRLSVGQTPSQCQARHGDERVTRVGGWLRATALDELPQLWNIFRGDMSFVGPRPLLPREAEICAKGRELDLKEIPGYAARHRVRPGLTGLAQVYARRDIPHRQKFRLDRLYIRRRSFGFDVKLILMSFWISFRGRWGRHVPVRAAFHKYDDVC